MRLLSWLGDAAQNNVSDLHVRDYTDDLIQEYLNHDGKRSWL
jgi:hypothetical protein